MKIELVMETRALEGGSASPDQETIPLPKLFVAAMNFAAVPVFMCFYLALPDVFHQFHDELDWHSALLILPALAGVILSHELVHLAFSQGSISHPSARILIVPKHFAVYAHTAAPMSRNQTLRMMLAPLVLLTIGPLLIDAYLMDLPTWAKMAAIANGVMSSGDLLIAWALLKAPRSAQSISVNLTGIHFTRVPPVNR
jgi:hypothetical protein